MKKNVAVPLIFIWVGFVCAISFMEAWLKFQAPGVTIPIGLGIGRLVFGALNKVEWVLFLCCIFCFFPLKKEILKLKILMGILFVILSLQTLWMLPTLDVRAGLFIEGGHVPPSNMHFYYVALEVLKVVCLITLGTGLFDRSLKGRSSESIAAN